MPTTRTELIAAARDAGSGDRSAIRLIRHLAINAGYNPRPGGWIYDDGRTVAHGWQAFADRAVDSRAVLDRLLVVVEREQAAAVDVLDGLDEIERVPSAPTTPAEPETAAPSVLLSQGTEPAEVPDAELLQLLALLDSGVRITRRLYQAWQVDGSPITLDPVKVDRAARAALAAGLAHAGGQEMFTLYAEPIHLLARGRDGMEAVCKRRLRRAGGQRLRYTTDASKATHDRCKR